MRMRANFILVGVGGHGGGVMVGFLGLASTEKSRDGLVVTVIGRKKGRQE